MEDWTQTATAKHWCFLKCLTKSQLSMMGKKFSQCCQYDFHAIRQFCSFDSFSNRKFKWTFSFVCDIEKIKILPNVDHSNRRLSNSFWNFRWVKKCCASMEKCQWLWLNVLRCHRQQRNLPYAENRKQTNKSSTHFFSSIYTINGICCWLATLASEWF